MSPIRSSFFKRSRHTHTVLASGTRGLLDSRANRAKLTRSSTWYSKASSDRLYSCWSTNSRTIVSVGYGGRPPLPRSPNVSFASIAAAIAAKSICRSSTCSGSPIRSRLAERSSPANRLIIADSEVQNLSVLLLRLLEVPLKGRGCSGGLHCYWNPCAARRNDSQQRSLAPSLWTARKTLPFKGRAWVGMGLPSAVQLC